MGTRRSRPLGWALLRGGRWSGHLLEEAAVVGTCKGRSLE